MRGVTTRVQYSPGLSSPPPRAHPDGTALAQVAITRAVRLICLVRDQGADGIGEFLDRCDTQGLYALCTALAVMVPDDRSANDLLSWLGERLEVAA